MNDKSLSVIMPNYNYGRYITEALQSILEQSRPADEIIVVDDASTDDSVQRVKELAQKHPSIILLQNQSNLGALASLNRGLSVATGRYIYTASSDDKTLPGLFEHSLKMLEQYPQAGFCCSDLLVLDNGQQIPKKAYLSDRPAYFDQRETLTLFLRDPFTPFIPHTIVYRRKDFDAAGGYRPELDWTSDSFAFSTVSFRSGFCYLPETMTVMRVHARQWGATNAKKFAAERRLVAKLLATAQLPEYRDVLPMFEKTAPFSVYPWEVLQVVAGSRKYRRFLSFKLLRFALFDKLIRRPLLWLIPMGLARRIVNLTDHLKFRILQWRKK